MVSCFISHFTAGVLTGYSMSPELREVGIEWTGVCGKPYTQPTANTVMTTILFYAVLFPWDGLLQVRKDKR